MGHSSGLLCSHVMTRTQHLTYLEEYNCILRFFFFWNGTKFRHVSLVDFSTSTEQTGIYIYIYKIRVLAIRTFFQSGGKEKESEEEEWRGRLSKRHSRKRYAGVTTRARVQLENFFFGLLPSLFSGCFTLVLACFHPRAIYGPSERHSGPSIAGFITK